MSVILDFRRETFNYNLLPAFLFQPTDMGNIRAFNWNCRLIHLIQPTVEVIGTGEADYGTETDSDGP